MRISTTTLESFRLFMQPDQEWMTEDSLIDSILGKFVPNQAVKLGSAFGKVLETPDRFRVPNGYACQGFTFDDATMAPALALMDRRGVYEAKASKRYGDCDVVAMADQIVGSHLYEHKTMASFTIEKYLDSYQWRFMANIFEPTAITYHVFVLDDHENGVATLKSIESFNVYPYPSLHEDCCALLRQFTEFVTVRGLDVFLRQRQAEAA